MSLCKECKKAGFCRIEKFMKRPGNEFIMETCVFFIPRDSEDTLQGFQEVE